MYGGNGSCAVKIYELIFIVLNQCALLVKIFRDSFFRSIISEVNYLKMCPE